MRNFAESIAASPASQLLASTSWVTPTLQIVHILSIAILFASVVMLDLRVLGFTGRSQTVAQTVGRFVPWFWAALAILAATGILMIVTEPVRELLALSFWIKMALVAVGAALAVALMRAARVADERAAPAVVSSGRAPGGLALAGGGVALAGGGQPGLPGRVRALGWATLAVWAAVIVLGRFIAYDPQIWGALSPLY